MDQFVVTIQRQFGSLGRPIAKEMSRLLGIKYYDRDIVDEAAKKLQLPASIVREEEEKAVKKITPNPFVNMMFPLGSGTTETQDKIFEAQKNKPQEFKQGKQTLKELMKQNTNISSIEITHDNIKDFEGTAKKYGIDFALKKDISENPPRYLVFFKGSDADVMEAAFKEYMAKNLRKEKKPSVKKALSVFKEAAEKNHKTREKIKVKDRGVEL